MIIKPPRRGRVSMWQKLNPIWALFGNLDDGIYGAGTKWNPAGERSASRAIRWWVRNPMHNLCWYVLGVADRWREVSDDRFHADVGWLVSSTVLVGRSIRLPYVSYRGARVVAYAGWRPSGAFGLKFQIAKRDPGHA